MVFQASDMIEARRQLKAFSGAFQTRAPKAVDCLDEAFNQYAKAFESGGGMERRERALLTFTNDDAALRLIAQFSPI